MGAFLALCWLLRDFVADDAWITARYADNLAGGRGLVWNPGGARVEGFSNPLLVGFEAVVHLLGAASIDAARALGVACGVALLLVIARLGPEAIGRTATSVALALTALCPPLALWAGGGLETLPATLVITAGTLLLCRPHAGRAGAVRVGALFAVLPWLRPEGLVVALVLAVLADGPGLLRRDRRRQAVGRLAFSAGLPVVSQLLLERVRLAAFGHLLPNSVLYKSGSGGGLDVLTKFAAQSKPVLALAAAGLLLARGRQRLLAVAPVVYGLGSIGTLDSANAYSRFFLPTWPLLALLAGLVAAELRARFRTRGMAVAVLATAVLLLDVGLLLPGNVRSAKAFAGGYSSCRQHARLEAAAWLRTRTPRDTTFSISDAGLVPAGSGGRTAIDQFLLNEPAIQRTGPLGVGPRVELTYDRRPDVLILASRTAPAFRGFYATDRRMEADRRLARYRLRSVARGAGPRCGYHLFIYRRGSAG